MFHGKKIAVLGMGEAGRAAATWLRSKGAVLSCFDDKPIQQWQQPFLDWCRENEVEVLEAKGFGQGMLRQFEFLVVSPGIPSDHPLLESARENKVPMVGELYLAASLWKGPMVAITGTNGKTTTTLLTTHLLNESNIDSLYAGNISPSLFRLMDKDNGRRCAVLEISSFQLEYFMDTPLEGLKEPVFECCVCLNVAPDHLDRHGDMEGYKRAKEKLFSYASENGYAVLGSGAESFKTRGRRILLSDVTLTKGDTHLLIPIDDDQKIEVSLSAWRPRGRHNLENLAASLICGLALGASLQKMERAMASFEVPSHRLESVGSLNGVEFIDDSKATNVHAVVKGLEAISNGKVILIAGGRAKGEDFSLLAQELNQMGNGDGRRVKAAILIGEAAKEIGARLRGVVEKIEVISGLEGQEVMDRAVEEAYSLAGEGDKVILSPACASFDMFQNYKARGESFKKSVQRILKG